jgi:Mn-dependent DtxR family transcriptional regulator
MLRANGTSLKLVAAKPASLETSESVDDYLKAILELGGAEESQVTTNALAERLGIRTPSVTGMLQKLASVRPALVLYEKHRGVRLTAAGKRRAWELVSIIACWNYFFTTCSSTPGTKYTRRRSALNISSRNDSKIE